MGARAHEQIHVGCGIINVTPPVNHPARVAERVAMMDHVSRGRFEFGTGRGSSTTEMGGFGITDPEITRDMYDEVDRRVQEHVARRHVLVRRPVLLDAERNVLPKPYVKPHPPMWVAAGNPETFEKAARAGPRRALLHRRLAREDGAAHRDYKKDIGNAEPVGEYVNDNIAVTTSFMCLEDRDEARDLMTHSGNGRQQTLVFHYLDTFPKPPFVPEWPTEIPDPTLDDIEKGLATGAAIVGTPDECAPACRSGSTSAATSSSWVRRARHRTSCARTVELFGDEVIPRFDKDPEHRTSRMREAAAKKKGK